MLHIDFRKTEVVDATQVLHISYLKRSACNLSLDENAYGGGFVPTNGLGYDGRRVIKVA